LTQFFCESVILYVVLLDIILHWQLTLENSSTTSYVWLLGCCETVEEKWINHKKFAMQQFYVILCAVNIIV